MKTFKNITILFLLFMAGVYTGCKKDPVMYGKGFESFKFIVKDALDANKEYEGIINGDEIVVQLPTEVDVTNLKASFLMDNPRTIVQVGSEVQESGITEQDFTNPVSYRVKAEDKSTRSYSVRVEKKVAFQSFGFYKEDNPGLEEDYKAVIRGLIIDIAVHETVDITKLVARFQTTTGAIIKVGAVTQESKVTPNNFNSPVAYTFTDAGLPASVDFKVALSFIGPKWWMIGDKSIIGSESSNLKMAIHPFTKYPYLVYIRSGKDENGAVIPDEKEKIAVISYTGTGWKNVGNPEGFSDDESDLAQIAFDDLGVPYVGYKDYYKDEQKATVLKYSNENWVPVGNKNFSPVKLGKFSFTIGEFNRPIAAAAASAVAPGYARQAIYVAANMDDQWNSITPSITNPLIGGVQVFKGLDGKTYMAVLDRSSNLSMYKYTDNTWKPVGPVSFRTSDGLPGFTSVIGAASADGTVYIGFQTVSANQRLNRVMKFNGTTWEELGSAGNSQDQTDKYALAVDPTGKLYFGFANTTGLYVRTFNDQTKNWNTPRMVVSGKINAFDMQVSPDGIPYLAVTTTTDKKITVYKYTNTK
ncbi:NHL repeat-containing protein [Pedobacter africanus]|uniref:DUF5018 domain-containing protein n=1 Tax=Pedobacter africanus TaxID=151894 RepID=A0A1W2ASC6_9SPHI|nr:hypothetical protein [Pedobacter africanus]SMC63494.1 hypothetical protein SAMN04488524_1623 [Pedobacter africanus]